ncbi:soluble lytic murein transglycosylase [Persephonella hydrogeniphila]|uniref:Soluble lytic murein transglycosylase n=1 Tax=Persephonella hydrogeniphila TaxID=198703 RepID=A0A285NBH2_9AQUI|nr:lytic transglycosylase domain-containing protein [Persephonella hydrogeniphila]SNZ06822.1 soluble lytic murein transglycosylase [Persephonella hydrogeniphila]
MKKLILILFIFSYSFGFEKCIELFNQEKYTEAYRCLQKINSDEPLYPYSIYFRILIDSFYERNTPYLKELERYKNTAIYSYTYLYLSSVTRFSQPEKAEDYLKKIDEKALLKEDLPFYYYLKAEILRRNGDESYKKYEKKLAVHFPYNRYYGFYTLKNKIKDLTEKELYISIENLIRKRMYKRALYITEFLSNSQRKIFYKAILYGRIRDFSKAFSYLILLKNNYRAEAAYQLIRINPAYPIQGAIFQILKETKNKKLMIKAADFMMKRAFYREKWEDFSYYSSFIPESSSLYSDVIWYRFLKIYKKDRKKAGIYLEKRKRYFKDKEKIYYWLYLSFKGTKKAEIYLKKAADIERNSFYAVRAREKLKRKLFKISDPKITKNRELRMIEKLKKYLYRFAYIEGKYYLKTNKDKITLSSVMPELTAVYFSNRNSISVLSYPKPFKNIESKNLVYAFMRRESFFNPYAISVSNAVGLMQIIPSTARWIAKKRKDKKFDITQLFIPEKNIDYGRWYIQYLLKKFRGNIFYSMAAYNCGPANVKKVLKKNRIRDIEEFIEFLPFRETRYYVKYVYTNYRAYQKLYKGK